MKYSDPFNFNCTLGGLDSKPNDRLHGMSEQKPNQEACGILCRRAWSHLVVRHGSGQCYKNSECSQGRSGLNNYKTEIRSLPRVVCQVKPSDKTIRALVRGVAKNPSFTRNRSSEVICRGGRTLQNDNYLSSSEVESGLYRKMVRWTIFKRQASNETNIYSLGTTSSIQLKQCRLMGKNNNFSDLKLKLWHSEVCKEWWGLITSWNTWRPVHSWRF